MEKNKNYTSFYRKDQSNRNYLFVKITLMELLHCALVNACFHAIAAIVTEQEVLQQQYQLNLEPQVVKARVFTTAKPPALANANATKHCRFRGTQNDNTL